MNVVFTFQLIALVFTYIYYRFTAMQARNAHLLAKHQENITIKYATFDDMDSFMQ